jgi:hypothetical protein
MPTYLYKCPIHDEFEEEHSIKIKLEFCPKCAEEGKPDVKIERLINCTSKGVVELYGQDLVDKVKSDTKQFKKEIYSNENSYANVLGDDKYESLQKQIYSAKRDRRK